MIGRLRHLDDAADLGDSLAPGDQLIGSALLRRGPSGQSFRMICSAVCLVRFMLESPAQAGRTRPLIQPRLVSGVHVSRSGETSRRQLLLGKVRCRQPEQILLPPELAVLLAEPAELGALLAVEQALVTGTGLAAIDAGLGHPPRQAAGRKAKPLGHGVAGKALLQTELHGLRVLQRREPAPCSGGVRH